MPLIFSGPVTGAPPMRIVPRLGMLQPGRQLHEGRLAAARRADDRDELAVVQLAARCPRPRRRPAPAARRCRRARRGRKSTKLTGTRPSTARAETSFTSSPAAGCCRSAFVGRNAGVPDGARVDPRLGAEGSRRPGSPSAPGAPARAAPKPSARASGLATTASIAIRKPALLEVDVDDAVARLDVVDRRHRVWRSRPWRPS